MNDGETIEKRKGEKKKTTTETEKQHIETMIARTPHSIHTLISIMDLFEKRLSEMLVQNNM